MYEHMNYDIWLTNEHEILLPHFITFTFETYQVVCEINVVP